MSHRLTERQMFRLTKADKVDLIRFAKAVGKKPGTIIRNLVISWLAAERYEESAYGNPTDTYRLVQTGPVDPSPEPWLK